MNLYYAFGGGLGHLTRAAAFIYTLGIKPDDFLIVSSSEYAKIVFEKHQILKVNAQFFHKPVELKLLIESYISNYEIIDFYIDTFPAGIVGELNNIRPNGCKINYVARYLKWENYIGYIKSNLLFDQTFVVDYIADEQLAFIMKCSKNQIELNLVYPPAANFKYIEMVLSKMKGKVWLIAHSGNPTELNTLFAHSKEIAAIEQVEPAFLIVGQVNIEIKGYDVNYLKYYPASDFFPFVDRIYTACGYNSMKQTMQFANKHFFIPFERRFDDQFIRAKQRNSLIQNL